MNQKNQPSSFWSNTSFPVAVAHRGGNAAGKEKENSLAAFQAANDLGYRWFETDVVPTSDGVLLAIHGRGWQRRANPDLPARLSIQRMSYDKAKKSISVGGERPLALETLLDKFPDVKVFIDPKTFTAAPVLADFLIARPQALPRVCIGSFHSRNTRLVKKRIKQATGCGVASAAIGKLRGAILIAASSANFLGPMLRAYLRFNGVEAFYLPYRQLTGAKGRKIVKFAHQNNLKIAAYTPNDQASIEAMVASGVDAIMSDNTGLLKACLKP